MSLHEFRLPAYMSGVDTTANRTGPWIDITDCAEISFQAKWSSTLTGTIGFDVTNDDPKATVVILGPVPAQTPTLPTGSAQPGGGAGGKAFFNFNSANFPRARQIRLTFAFSVGGAANDLFVGVHGIAEG